MHAVRVAITDGPLDPHPPRMPPDTSRGALLAFLGIVRGEEDGNAIEGLEYTTYDPMAERMLASLARQSIDRFGVRAVLVEHSRGMVSVGRCSFRLAIAGAHRREAIDALDWFIETMKADVPIWKRPVAVARAHHPDRNQGASFR